MIASFWLLDLRCIALDAMRALLSADEQARADQYRQEGDIARFAKSRGALRRILAERTRQDARDLVFVEGGGRKPGLRDYPSLHFNLSHSGDFALIAVGAQPLGVDIEAIRDIDWRALAAMNFHPDERAILHQRSEGAARDAFFQFWTHKEAFLKATGIGLSEHLTAIKTPLEGGLISAPKTLSSDAWYAIPLDAPHGYAASIVSGSAQLAPRDLTASFSS
ncbi:MAG: 4-phosphopantetheinyl transferase [Hyphomicrobiales bacterium]|nr:4-phosphopantetheinyl transferase [Hyphomicrobiales bacterium]